MAAKHHVAKCLLCGGDTVVDAHFARPVVVAVVSFRETVRAAAEAASHALVRRTSSMRSCPYHSRRLAVALVRCTGFQHLAPEPTRKVGRMDTPVVAREAVMGGCVALAQDLLPQLILVLLPL